jgi:ribosomal protein S27E
MPAQSRRDKEEMALRRQEAGPGYKVALRLTAVAMAVGDFVSMWVFHAPYWIPGKLGFLIATIYGVPGFAPFLALFLILWYNPPQKKVQEKPPTTSGAPQTDTTTTKVRCLHCQHVQAVPRSQMTFVCEQCGAHLKRGAAATDSS